jgi:hypothetical protein
MDRGVSTLAQGPQSDTVKEQPARKIWADLIAEHQSVIAFGSNSRDEARIPARIRLQGHESAARK